jgi:hypothetical protein
MTKDKALNHWNALPENQNPMPYFEEISYKAEGSSYGACGVRIDGSPEFIDAVLSRLKPLLAAENGRTRLELTRKKVEARPGRPLHKAATHAEVCYIRRHERGGQAQMMNAYLGRA